QEFIRSLF
nr:Chain G, DNA LIGASE [Helicobacter pylori 26695]5FRQ_L Chain L, DNA LIGASE [Helicobacter pylori 26695]